VLRSEEVGHVPPASDCPPESRWIELLLATSTRVEIDQFGEP
jgi:hypothetical protein